MAARIRHPSVLFAVQLLLLLAALPVSLTFASPDRPINVWSNQPTLTMSWNGASDGNGSGVHGYSFKWATSPGALPDTTLDTIETSIHTAIPADGDNWYFVLRTVDNAGNWTPGAAWSGPYKLDTVPPSNPSSIVTNPPAVVWSKDNTISASWGAASDNADGSGVAGFSTLFDPEQGAAPDNIVDTTLHSDGSGVVADGRWWFTLKTCDHAGNCAAKMQAGPVLIDVTPPASYAGQGQHEKVELKTATFTVHVSGRDTSSGIKRILLEVRDETANLPQYLVTGDAQPGHDYNFTRQMGHLYCFRTRGLDNAGNLEPAKTQPDTCVGAATADLIADKLIITQGIQNGNMDAALIAGRRTLARCYVHSAVQDYDRVTARLGVSDSKGNSLGTLTPLNSRGRTTVKLSPRLDLMEDSLYFEVPASWVTTEKNKYLCYVNTTQKYYEKNYANNSVSVSVAGLVAPAKFKILLVDLPYLIGVNQQNSRSEGFANIESYLRRLYPVAKMTAAWGRLDPPYPFMLSKSILVDDLIAIRINEILLNGGDPEQYWYGLISNASGKQGGVSRIGSRVAVGSAGPAKPNGCSGGDETPTYDGMPCGDHLAGHEIGHSIGRHHIVCTGGEEGVDTNYPFDGGLISDSQYLDDLQT